MSPILIVAGVGAFWASTFGALALTDRLARRDALRGTVIDR